MNPYQHCTRCGEELSDNLKKKYKEKHTDGPVLCLGCYTEIFNNMAEAISSAMTPVMKSLNEAMAPLAKAFTEMGEKQR